jgi:ABC-type microcin C transport system permease subunit YejE
MSGSEAFDTVCIYYDLDLVEISANSGVSRGALTRYKNDERDITSEKLVAVLRAMPAEARDLYIGLISGEQQVVITKVR